MRALKMFVFYALKMKKKTLMYTIFQKGFFLKKNNKKEISNQPDSGAAYKPE